MDCGQSGGLKGYPKETEANWEDCTSAPRRTAVA
jgi:hypothetical protein